MGRLSCELSAAHCHGRGEGDPGLTCSRGARGELTLPDHRAALETDHGLPLQTSLKRYDGLVVVVRKSLKTAVRKFLR